MSSHQPRRRSFVWPVILIGLGLILLLHNFGLLPWDGWYLLGRFWPVILILIGLELMLSRTNPWLATAMTAAVLFVLIAGGVALAALGYSRPAVSATGEPTHLSEEIGEIRRATVELQFGAGELYLGSLAAESANLMEGEFDAQGGAKAVSRTFRCQDGDCELRLVANGQQRDWFWRNQIGTTGRCG